MSAPYVPLGEEERGQLAYDYDDERGQGLVTFAGILLLIAAALNILFGIAAIDKANVFVNDARYVFGDLSLWGWFVLALGVVQGVAAFAIWRGVPWARWFGVACAACNAMLQALWIPAYPILAMTILTLDVIIIWGLCAYGGRRRTVRETRARARAAG